jgi:RHS repeat-associated protein
MAHSSFRKGPNNRTKPGKCRRPRRFWPEIELLEERELMTATPTPNGRFVNQLFQDLLQRPADPGAVAAYGSLLDQGAIGRSQVAVLIAGSREYHTDEVSSQFKQLLNRAASPSELAAFTGFLDHGGTLEQLQADLAGSGEYYQTRGNGTDVGFIAALFSDAMHRSPSMVEAANFGRLLAGGMSHVQVAGLVFGTAEVLQDRVAGLYPELLRRTADSAGAAAWAAALQNGLSDAQLIASFAGTAEYFTTNVDPRGTPNQVFVTQLFEDLLGRPAGSAAVTAYGGLLDQGALSRGQVVGLIAGGSEYHAGEVQIQFQQLLNRAAGAGELAAFTGFLDQGGTLEQLQATLAGSGEYYQTRGASTDAGFITALFNDALHRAPSPPELAGFEQMLAGGTGRGQLAALLFSSSEARQGRVEGDYVQLLRRAADSSGLAGWVSALQSGLPDAQLIGGLAGSTEYFVVAGTLPPRVTILSPTAGLTTLGNVTVTGQVADLVWGVKSLQAVVDSGSSTSVSFDAAGNFQFTTSLPADGSADGNHTLHLTAADPGGNMAAADFAFTLDAANPAAHVALDTSVATSTGLDAGFLYSGSSPVQTGVSAGTIDPVKTAVLRGQVVDPSGNPLAGVTVTILNHPEFGQTQTRASGLFDMAINGGQTFVVNFAKTGYLPVQRQVDPAYQDYVQVPTVALMAPDSQVTALDLSSAAPVQVARGNPVTDADGPRQATVFFFAGTQANLVLSGGTTQPVTTLHVRATEYTVGQSGPEAMPGDLPGTSAYTYAVELSADEEQAAGATGVTFSQSASFYVENFLNFPVGTISPMGYYDHTTGQWVATANGRIIRILSITNGLADLDIDRSGLPAGPAALAALGISDAERQELAILYRPGQSLSRVPIVHFSSYDNNFPAGPPSSNPNASRPDAKAPQMPQAPAPDTCDCNDSHGGGSIISPVRQTVDEPVAVTGTPFALNYISDRVPGRLDNYSRDILLSGPTIPADLQGIQLVVDIAGEHFTQTFPAGPNLTYHFTWDGKDGFGRTVQGLQTATIKIGYLYPGVYEVPSSQGSAFGQSTGQLLEGTHSRQDLGIWQVYQESLGSLDSRAAGLGGWGLNILNAYDPVGQVVYFGDGTTEHVNPFSTVVTTVAGNGTVGYSGDGGPATQAELHVVDDVAVGPDGSLYIVTDGDNRVRKVDPKGIITTVAGNGTAGFSGDGGPATQAQFNFPTGITVGPDGGLYIADAGNNRIRRVAPNGIITTVAGTGAGDFNGDGGPAVQADLDHPTKVVVGPDGTLYIADSLNQRIRRVGTDGIITTLAGNGTVGYSGDGGPATRAELYRPVGLAAGLDGSVYIADMYNQVIRRVWPNGTITTLAGNGIEGYSGDGGPATQAQFNYPNGLALAPDGSLYVSDGDNGYIRRINSQGVVTTVAGTGTEALNSFNGDGLPGTAAAVGPLGVALGPDGSLYIADFANSRIRKLAPSLPGLSAGDAAIASQDGSEVYVFDQNGRHLRTQDALSGVTLYQFNYDSAGRLSSIIDRDGNTTLIERDASGNPTAIVAPNGQATKLALTSDGYLAGITDPAGASVSMTYGTGGLLATFTDTLNIVHTMSYDNLGRLAKDADSTGGFFALARTDQADGYTITETTATGVTDSITMADLPTGEHRVVTTDSAGLQTVQVTATDGTTTTSYPDGAVETEKDGPDPRWGMMAPVITVDTVKTPGGLTNTTAETRTVTLSDLTNPLGPASQTDILTVNGQSEVLAYDAGKNQLTDTSPAGRTTVELFDAKGHLVATQVPGVDAVQYAYDANGRLVTVTQGTRVSRFTYDVHWDVASAVDPLQHTQQFTYDADGRMLTQTLPDNSVVAYRYDAAGDLLSLAPPQQSATNFTYNALGLEQSDKPPAVGGTAAPTQYTYNADRQLTQVQHADGTVLGLAYDSAGRTSAITLPTVSVSLAYDPVTGNLATVSTSDGTNLVYGYDGNLPTNTVWMGTVAGQVQDTYDNNFRVVSESIDRANPVSFQYEADGLLTQAGGLGLTYDAHNGQLIGSTLGTVTDALGYNEFGELNSYQAAVGSTGVYAVQDSYNADGQVTQRTETIGGVTHAYVYIYDLQGRLTEVQKDGAVQAQYTYDANGNRLGYTGPGGTVSGTYDSQDRLTQYGSLQYTYTADGFLQSKTDTATHQTSGYVYDAQGDLRTVTLPDSTRIDYVIDGAGERIGKKVNGVLVQGLLYDSEGRVVAELDGRGNLVSQFVYASSDNVPDYLIKGGVAYRIISDPVGSPRLIINTATGQVVQRLDYDEFGNVLQDTNPGFQPFGFAGGLYDGDTKLVHFGARDYDPQTGRWTAKDPTLYAGGQFNLYAYANNDPINEIDPSGLKECGKKKEKKKKADQSKKKNATKPLVTHVNIPRNQSGIPPGPYHKLLNGEQMGPGTIQLQPGNSLHAEPGYYNPDAPQGQQTQFIDPGSMHINGVHL